MPNVDDAVLDGGSIIFLRSNVVFAVRARDAGVLWKRPCERPPYVVVAGARLITFCGSTSTVLRARDGTVLATSRPTIRMSPPHLDGGRALNADYVFVANFFDGAWMGHDYYVVDAHTGEFLWDETDCDVIDITPTTVSITPSQSMLPWGKTGLVERRRLTDGRVLSSRTYVAPHADDVAGGGRLFFSRAAAYVAVYDGLYRFAHGDAAQRQRVPVGNRVDSVVTLGEAAFIVTDWQMNQPGNLYIDRPTSSGSYVTNLLGASSVRLTIRPIEGRGAPNTDAVRTDDRVAVSDGRDLQLYDASGRVELTANVNCNDALPVAARETLFTLCIPPQKPLTIAAFRR